MKIQGLQKTTLLDYPGHVAATIFLGGCNFRCPFCHNMNIVDPDFSKDESLKNEYTEEEVLSFLEKRNGILEAVCITGGEPTLYNDLPEFIKKIKGIGTYKIKLDTNGTNSKMLQMLINDGLIDYVAMDIKSSEEKYYESIGLDNKTSNINAIIDRVKESINILINSEIEYEFRTTIVDKLHTKEEIIGIGKLIKGAKRHYLQSFKDSEYVLDHSLSSVDKEKLLQFQNIMATYVNEASIRGVD